MGGNPLGHFIDIPNFEAERDAAVKEMEARELHHFEVEEENAMLQARIARALEFLSQNQLTANGQLAAILKGEK